MQKVSNSDLLETISEKYDNEISVYKLVAFEDTILENKMLTKYVLNSIINYQTISISIKRTINKSIRNNQANLQ